MTIDYYINKLRFYTTWYKSMCDKERQSEIGRWVVSNISIFTEIIVKEHEDVAMFYPGSTNYKPMASL
jgi:hypothetical protein